MKLMDYIYNNRFYLDGAMGSRVLELGFPTDNLEVYNIENSELIAKIHKEYLDAGANMIYTNTFGANGLKLKDCSYSLKEIITAAYNIARDAADIHNAYVAYCCGPLGELIEPYSDMSFENAYNYYKEQADIVKHLNVDCVVIETISDTLELKAAILAFKENTDHIIWCSMSFNKSGRTYQGAKIQSYAMLATALGASVIGINCSLGVNEMLNNAKELLQSSCVPVFIKPNAGLPLYKNGKTVYDIDSNQFSDYISEIANLGVSILGGCCGTNGDYIKKTIEKTTKIPFIIPENFIDGVCSRGNVVEFINNTTTLIGERLNPTGKPALKEAIINDDYDYILSMCVSQIESGADILDVNVGMGGIDEREKMVNVIKQLTSYLDIPLQLDSTRINAIEAGLRLVNGVPIINSVNGEQESLDSVLPLAKKYGAYVIGLCLDKQGIPKDPAGRLAIARKIVESAEKYGIDKKRVIIDPLTLTISVDKNNAMITLESLKLIKKQLDVKVTLGLSNVSYGLPARDILNSTFYDMAIKCGLDSVIINPNIKPLYDNDAYLALSGQDTDLRNYIKSKSAIESKREETQSITIEYAIEKGLKKQGMSALIGIVNQDNYMDIINNNIIGALNKVGEHYEKGRKFLPELISSADCAGAMLDYIKEKYINEGKDTGSVMLIATVEGDIHDIGKNIVKAILSNYGVKIYDLGKNVGVDAILTAIDKYNPKIIGLSALMTTTLDNMERITRIIKEKHKDIIIMCGGAVVTEDYVKNIGADIYALDAQDAVVKLKRDGFIM